MEQPTTPRDLPPLRRPLQPLPLLINRNREVSLNILVTARVIGWAECQQILTEDHTS